MCKLKGVSLKSPFIPTFSGMIGRKEPNTRVPKGVRLKATTIQFVGEDKEYGWGLILTLVMTAQ